MRGAMCKFLLESWMCSGRRDSAVPTLVVDPADQLPPMHRVGTAVFPGGEGWAQPKCPGLEPDCYSTCMY